MYIILELYAINLITRLKILDDGNSFFGLNINSNGLRLDCSKHFRPNEKFSVLSLLHAC